MLGRKHGWLGLSNWLLLQHWLLLDLRLGLRSRNSWNIMVGFTVVVVWFLIPNITKSFKILSLLFIPLFTCNVFFLFIFLASFHNCPAVVFINNVDSNIKWRPCLKAFLSILFQKIFKHFKSIISERKRFQNTQNVISFNIMYDYNKFPLMQSNI